MLGNGRRHIATILLCLFTFVFVTFAYILQLDNPWYGSSVCFPLGVIYAECEEKCNNYLQKNYWIKNIGNLVICSVCIILFFVLGNHSIIGNPIARNVASLSFSIWLISILHKIKLDNKILYFLGSISYEVFLIHPIMIQILQKSNIVGIKLLTMCIILTLVIAYVCHIFLDKLVTGCLHIIKKAVLHSRQQLNNQ